MALVGGLCFCVACGNLLERPMSNEKELRCETCETVNPNRWPLTQTSTSGPDAFPSALRRKKNSNIQELREEDLQNTSTINQPCPQCDNEKMNFQELQLRGADEGTTIFFDCPKCGYKYNTNN